VGVVRHQIIEGTNGLDVAARWCPTSHPAGGLTDDADEGAVLLSTALRLGFSGLPAQVLRRVRRLADHLVAGARRRVSSTPTMATRYAIRAVAPWRVVPYLARSHLGLSSSSRSSCLFLLSVSFSLFTSPAHADLVVGEETVKDPSPPAIYRKLGVNDRAAGDQPPGPSTGHVT